jgi:hypothetical protein
MDQELAQYREDIRPRTGTTADQYTLTITQQMETDRGVAWTGTIHRNQAPVGTITDHGNGGAPNVTIPDPAERTLWTETLTAAYPGDGLSEENFIAHLDFCSQGM